MFELLLWNISISSTMIIPTSISEKSFKFGTVPFTFLVSEGIPPIIIPRKISIVITGALSRPISIIFANIATENTTPNTIGNRYAKYSTNRRIK